MTRADYVIRTRGDRQFKMLTAEGVRRNDSQCAITDQWVESKKEKKCAIRVKISQLLSPGILVPSNIYYWILMAYPRIAEKDY